MPKVSLLIPICNVERYLEECLDSARRQTLSDIEVICIDDGSTDSSPQIVDRYAEEDPRFRAIHKPNSGYGDSMNQGLAKATGEYVAILESDDVLERDALERLVELADEAQADVAKADFWLYWSCPVSRRVAFGIVDPSWTGRVVDPQQEREIFYRKPSIWSAVYRRSFLVENGIGFLTTPGASYQDAGFNFKVWASAERVVFDTAQVLSYRQDNEKSSVNSPGKVFCVCDEYAEMARWLHERRESGRCSIVEERDLEHVLARMKFNTYMWNFERLTPELRGDFVARASEEFAADMQAGIVDFGMFDPAGEADYRCIASDPARFCELRAKFPSEGKVDVLHRYMALGGPSLMARIADHKLRGRRAETGAVEETAELDEMLACDASDDSDASDDDPALGEQSESAAQAGARKPQPVPTPDPIDWGTGPMVSVVVPVYNVEGYVGECLDSLLAQTLERIQIVCVNDGSTDGSRRVLASYAERDPRIKIVDQPNGGLSAARNSGIAASDAPVVAFLDADDAYAPNACKRIVCAFADTCADIVTFGAECVPDCGGDQWLVKHLSPRDAVFNGYSSRLIFEEASHPYPRTSCTKAFLERENLSFDETLRYGEDELFYLSAYPVARRVALISNKVYRYRVAREGSLTAGIDFGSAEVMGKHIEVTSRVLTRWRELYGEADVSGEVATPAQLDHEERMRRLAQIAHWSVDYVLYGIFCLDAPDRAELLPRFGLAFAEALGIQNLQELLGIGEGAAGSPVMNAQDAELARIALDVAAGAKAPSDLEAKALRLKYVIRDHGIAHAMGKLAGKSRG